MATLGYFLSCEEFPQAVPCGPDPKPYVERLRAFVDAGYDEVYVQQIGPEQDRFFDFWESEIAPEFAA